MTASEPVTSNAADGCPVNQGNEKRTRRQSFGKSLFVLSGIVPLLGLLGTPRDTALIIYTFFVAACLARPWLVALSHRLPIRPVWQLLILFLLSGTLTETLAWGTNYAKAAEEPALLHPQLIPDIILGFGFYGGWAFAWLITFRWFRFTLAETFLITGFQGIVFEQLGGPFIVMLQLLPTNPLFSLVIALYIAAVHGSAVGFAMVPVVHRFDRPGQSRHWVRFLIVMVLMVALAAAGTLLVGLISFLFGGLPPKQSIVDHPLW